MGTGCNAQALNPGPGGSKGEDYSTRLFPCQSLDTVLGQAQPQTSEILRDPVVVSAGLSQ